MFRGSLSPKKIPMPALPASVPLEGHAPSVYMICASAGMLYFRRTELSLLAPALVPIDDCFPFEVGAGNVGSD